MAGAIPPAGTRGSVGEAEGWEAVDEAILMRELKAEAVERAEIEQTIALSERLSPQGSLPLSHKLSTEGAQMNEAVQAIAKSVHDMERARDRFEAHGNLRRDVFISEMGRLLKLAIDGLAGCLHSVQSLRNQELSRSSGDVHAAGQRIIQVVSALSNLMLTILILTWQGIWWSAHVCSMLATPLIAPAECDADGRERQLRRRRRDCCLHWRHRAASRALTTTLATTPPIRAAM